MWRKNDAAHQSLAAQIAAHTAYRGYEAIVVGSVKDDTGTVDKPIARHKTDRKKMAIVEGGRDAITHYTVIKRYNGYTYMAFQLETGRTHQIRVHMASLSHPLLGDSIYGHEGFLGFDRAALHSFEITCQLPGHQDLAVFSGEMPEDFQKMIVESKKLSSTLI